MVGKLFIQETTLVFYNKTVAKLALKAIYASHYKIQYWLVCNQKADIQRSRQDKNVFLFQISAGENVVCNMNKKCQFFTNKTISEKHDIVTCLSKSV